MATAQTLTDRERRVLLALEDVWQTAAEVGNVAKEPTVRGCAAVLRSLVRKGLAGVRRNRGVGTFEHGLAEYAITGEADQIAAEIRAEGGSDHVE